MRSKEIEGIAAYLAAIAADESSGRAVAQTVELTLIGVEDALIPIVGSRAVAALFDRAVHLARSTHPWLPESPAGRSTAIDAAPLVAALSQQGPTEAASAGARVLCDLHALLVSLIGPSLTERLLRSVWLNFSSGASAQDNTP